MKLEQIQNIMTELKTAHKAHDFGQNWKMNLQAELN